MQQRIIIVLYCNVILNYQSLNDFIYMRFSSLLKNNWKIKKRKQLENVKNNVFSSKDLIGQMLELYQKCTREQ